MNRDGLLLSASVSCTSLQFLSHPWFGAAHHNIAGWPQTLPARVLFKKELKTFKWSSSTGQRGKAIMLRPNMSQILLRCLSAIMPGQSNTRPLIPLTGSCFGAYQPVRPAWKESFAFWNRINLFCLIVFLMQPYMNQLHVSFSHSSSLLQQVNIISMLLLLPPVCFPTRAVLTCWNPELKPSLSTQSNTQSSRALSASVFKFQPARHGFYSSGFNRASLLQMIDQVWLIKYL